MSAWEVEPLTRQGFNLLVTARDLYPSGRPERVIGATGIILEDKPEWVKSFLKGMIRAYWFIRDQPENFDYVNRLEARLRLESLARNERVGKFVCQHPSISRRCLFLSTGERPDSKISSQKRKRLENSSMTCLRSKTYARSIWYRMPLMSLSNDRAQRAI